MSYKPTIAAPFYRRRFTDHKGPMQPCIVCAVKEDGAVNLLTFDEECNVMAVFGAVIVQQDEDGCPCHYTDPLPPLEPPKPVD